MPSITYRPSTSTLSQESTLGDVQTLLEGVEALSEAQREALERLVDLLGEGMDHHLQPGETLE